MNELPVIGFSCLRRDFWVPHWKYIATRWKEMYGEGLFRRPEKRFWREIITFSPLFYQKWIWVMLILGKRKFLFEQP